MDKEELNDQENRKMQDMQKRGSYEEWAWDRYIDEFMNDAMVTHPMFNVPSGEVDTVVEVI